jgi:soluble lytic murein transglycosylase
VLQAKSQWWFALARLDKSYTQAASKLAQQWGWDEVAIFTLAKIQYWDDVKIRFPLGFVDNINLASSTHKLNPILLYGLIRQESAFNQNARSRVGASGLMQIMPKTGKLIAKALKEPWRGSKSLLDPATNIKYGAYYYQSLLDKFDGDFAVALAAYNAGPHNAKKWLPKIKTRPADIWIETIPFYETRHYVATVLSYAMIYQLRTRTSHLMMKHLTQDIKPLRRLP